MHDLTVPKWFYLAPSELLSPASWWAELILPTLTFCLSLSLFPLISQTAVSLILRRTHFTSNKCILLFTHSLIYALCGFFHFLQCICEWLGACSPCMWTCRWGYEHVLTCTSVGSVWAERRTVVVFSPWCCFTLLLWALNAISSNLETKRSIISIIAGKRQSAFKLLLIFSNSYTQEDSEVWRSRNYWMMCFSVCV